MDTEARRRAILDAALDAVADGGLPALTIAELTRRSGASNGSIYHHFGGRSGVLAALYQESFARCIEAMLPALNRRSTRLSVVDMTDRFLSWVQHNQIRASFLYTAPASGALTELTHAKLEIFSPVATWFTARISAGDIRDIPLWTLDSIVMGPAHECARRYLISPDAFDLSAARPIVADAIWAILRP